jgi:hypothetical protein
MSTLNPIVVGFIDEFGQEAFDESIQHLIYLIEDGQIDDAIGGLLRFGMNDDEIESFLETHGHGYCLLL